MDCRCSALAHQPAVAGGVLQAGADRSAADAEIIAALNELVTVELRWGFWKCYDRLRQMGKR